MPMKLAGVRSAAAQITKKQFLSSKIEKIIETETRLPQIVKAANLLVDILRREGFIQNDTPNIEIALAALSLHKEASKVEYGPAEIRDSRLT